MLLRWYKRVGEPENRVAEICRPWINAKAATLQKLCWRLKHQQERGRHKIRQGIPHTMDGKATQVTLLSLKPGFEDVLLPELAAIVEASRQISGCLAFDLYRLSEERSTLVLHEIWKTREALKAYAFSPLKTEMTTLVVRFLVRPLRSWDVEEIG
jgi:quinol monooxygenase YgiN